MEYNYPGDTVYPPEQATVWRQLALRTQQADPFCSCPLWQLSFHAAVAPSRRLHIRTADEAVLAFAEQPLSDGTAALTPIESHWLFGASLIGRNAPVLLEDWLDEVAAERTDFAKILLSGIRPRGERAVSLLRRLDKRFRVLHFADGLQCAASLKGGLDGFLARRSANHRQKLAKARRRGEQAGIVFERHAPRTAEDAAQLYARMLAVERASWKGIAACGMTEQPARQLYAVLVRNLAQEGLARIMFARHEETDIGFIFGGKAGNIYRGQQFSYHEAWKRWGIGNLLQVEQVRWLCEEGARRYDMGPLDGAAMRYKEHWTEKRLPIQSWLLLRR